MLGYIARRILLMIPTLFGLMLISFTIVQFAPGGPVERIIAQLQGNDAGGSRLGGGGGDLAGSVNAQQSPSSSYRGAQGIDPEFGAQLNKQFGFDNPAPERLSKMLFADLR